MRRRHAFRVLAALALAACGLDVVGTGPESSELTAPDAAGGVALDGAVDAPVTPADTGPGVTDAAPDATSEVDAGEEAGGDAGDAGKDGGADSGTDANPCAACSGTAHATCAGNTCVAGYRVFITSTGSTANLGGIVGADAKCQSLADAAHLGGTWRAWLSVSASTKPNNRFTQSPIPYRLVDGTTIANDWSDLISGSIRAPIQIDETGKTVAATEVWTGTASSGNFATTGCDGFTNGTDNSVSNAVTVGVSDQKDDLWTNVYVQFCNRTTQRLYCFEQ